MDASDDPDDRAGGDDRNESATDERRSDDAVDPWADDGSADWVDDATADEGGAAGTTPDAGPDEDGPEVGGGTRDDRASDDAGSTDAATPGRRRYRVLDRDGDALVFVDLDTPDPGPGPAPDEGFEPLRVAAGGYDGDLADAVADLDPGYVVEATLRWPDADAEPASTDADRADPPASTPLARVDSLSVERRSDYRFADGVEPMFEAARDAWRDARAAGEGMGSRVTRDTDGEPNGALYVFAEAGARDLLGEFRSGTTPLEPLVERVNDDLDDDGPRAVFVLRPADGGYVAVYIAFEADGLLARTVRDTYL